MLFRSVPRGLLVRVGVGRGGEVGAGGGEVGGEPGHGVAVGSGLLHSAVEVDDGGDAGAGARRGEGAVPRQEVAWREVVGPRHARGDATYGGDGGAGDGGRVPAGAEGEDPRRR